ncbi:MAG: hypothetical protein H7338_07795 [Candidatus Sericytochromatia bacterium]|nr:hypothetical protein [Candidatus Sericytochromatia bacterium]
MQIHAEFTADDRITLEISGRGMIIRYESFRQLGKVNYSVKGYEPFFEGEWLPIARFDNRKGTAQREVVRPTPMAYSALGLHFKDQWGTLTPVELFEKALEDIAENWETYRSNYDGALPAVSEDKRKQAAFNIKLLRPTLLLLVTDENTRKIMTEGMSFTPMPRENDWLLEQNTLAISKIYKKALRGELTFRQIGDHRLITHAPHEIALADIPAPSTLDF